MSTLASSRTHITHPNVAARQLRDIGRAIARAVSGRLPGLDHKLETSVVFVADGASLAGPLGVFATNGYAFAGRTYDRLNVAIPHPGHTDVIPTHYATDLVTTLVHDLAHAAALMEDPHPTAGIVNDDHGEGFARAASQLDLRVVRCSAHPGQVSTPALTADGLHLYQPQSAAVAQLNPALVRGIGLAGPDRLEGTLALRPRNQVPLPYSPGSLTQHLEGVI